MVPKRALLLLIFASACATTRAPEKLSFQDAFGVDEASSAEPPPTLPVVMARPSKKRATRRPKAASTSTELQSALVAFAARARLTRSQTDPGQPMPLVQAANWDAVAKAVGKFLERSPEETSSFDLIRARVTLEAELELDAREYGDFPPQLADRVLNDVTRVAVRMAEVRRLKVRTEDSAPRFLWPVQPVAVTSLFGKRLHPIRRVYKLHFGLDLAAQMGQLVSSAGAGTVTRADWNGSHGLHIEVQHASGISTRYSHLSQLLVEVGALVRPGDSLGLAGSTGSSTGPHLHFEFWRDGKPRDPLEEMAPSESPRSSALALR